MEWIKNQLGYLRRHFYLWLVVGFVVAAGIGGRYFSDRTLMML